MAGLPASLYIDLQAHQPQNWFGVITHTQRSPIWFHVRMHSCFHVDQGASAHTAQDTLPKDAALRTWLSQTCSSSTSPLPSKQRGLNQRVQATLQDQLSSLQKTQGHHSSTGTSCKQQGHQGCSGNEHAANKDQLLAACETGTPGSESSKRTC